MKAIVIVGASLKTSPYAFPYINELLGAGYNVIVLIWERDDIEDIKPDERVKVIQYKRFL